MMELDWSSATWARRVAGIGLLVTLAGCAHTGVAGEPMRVQIDPTPSSIEPGIVDVTLTNLTDAERCVRRDTVESPQTNDIWVRLRSRGRLIPDPPEGYILPPRVAGLRPLASGESVSFRLDIRGRFETRRSERPERWDVRIGISSFPCSAPYVGSDAVSWSDWTSFSYADGHN